MDDYKREFIEFMIDSEVLKFGDFVTKSGRKTPFFVNTGFYRSMMWILNTAPTARRLRITAIRGFCWAVPLRMVTGWL